MVKAKPSPVSSLMVQLLYLLHIPLMGAKPAQTKEERESEGVRSKGYSVKKIKPQVCNRKSSLSSLRSVTEHILSVETSDRFGKQQGSVIFAFCIHV